MKHYASDEEKIANKPIEQIVDEHDTPVILTDTEEGTQLDMSDELETVKPNEPEKPETKKKKHTGRNIAMIIIAIIIIILLLLRSCNTPPTMVGPEKPSWSQDDLTGEKVLPATDDHDKIVAELNKKVAEGMFEISMNTTPVFANGQSEGNLMIVNSDSNRHYMVVEIIEETSGETIYTSKPIKIGYKIDNAKLDVNLPAGKYSCTAYFHAINVDSMEETGKAGAKIEVTIAESKGTTTTLTPKPAE